MSLHVWMGADLLPVSYDASLHGECSQLLLVGHHKADDVVLVTENKQIIKFLYLMHQGFA